MRSTMCLLLGVLLFVAGCDAEESQPTRSRSTPATARAQHPIRNGTRNPQVIALGAGELLAFGWIHLQGEIDEVWCSGFLVSPNAVITAGHCVTDREAARFTFGIGIDPNMARANFEVRDYITHPELDIAVVVLTSNVPDRVPEVQTIPFSRLPPDEGLVGRLVETVGYGWTMDPAREGRYFAAVEVTEIRPTEIVVSGRELMGPCGGDSGSPMMLMDPEGNVLAVAIESNGDDSCVGTDYAVRTDVVAEWLDDAIVQAACGEITDEGECWDTLLIRCEDLAVVRRECADTGQVCLPGPPAHCADSLPDGGVVDRDAAVRWPDAGGGLWPDWGPLPDAMPIPDLRPMTDARPLGDIYWPDLPPLADMYLPDHTPIPDGGVWIRVDGSAPFDAWQPEDAWVVPDWGGPGSNPGTIGAEGPEEIAGCSCGVTGRGGPEVLVVLMVIGGLMRPRRRSNLRSG